MSDIYKELQETILTDLDLPLNIKQPLTNAKIQTAYDLHKKLMTKKIIGFDNWPGVAQKEMNYLQELKKRSQKGRQYHLKNSLNCQRLSHHHLNLNQNQLFTKPIKLYDM